MGRKGKKIQQDDWESEVDAIAQENAESAYDGVALESLFAKLLAAGVVSESDYDRATDELASGVKSERQLMLEWEKKTCRKDEAATADQQAAELGSSGNLKDESAAPSDDALSETMQQSERHIEAWRRAAKSDPMQLPLARMTAVCLSGTYGVSTHADRNVRLWDSATGRRLGAHQHKLELTACCAREECVAVGDAAGMVHIYDTESEFVPLRLTGGSGAVRSIELLRVEGGTLVLGSGEATLTAWFTNTDGSPASRAVPLNFALKGLHLSAGPSGCVYGASRSLVTLYDLNASAAAWRGGVSGPSPSLCGAVAGLRRLLHRWLMRFPARRLACLHAPSATARSGSFWPLRTTRPSLCGTCVPHPSKVLPLLSELRVALHGCISTRDRVWQATCSLHLKPGAAYSCTMCGVFLLREGRQPFMPSSLLRYRLVRALSASQRKAPP